MKPNSFDVVVIGSGPAGLSAALWADELGLSSILLESKDEAGGQLLYTFNRIDNHLGMSSSNGIEMRDELVRHLAERRPEIRFNSNVRSIDSDKKTVELSDGTLIGYSALLIATGVRRRTLGVPGEEEFRGRGVLMSGKREAADCNGKRAVVVGGGDAAFENALILSEFASHVNLIHHRKGFSARQEFVELVEAEPRINVITDARVIGIEGTHSVNCVLIKNTVSGAETRILTDAAVVRIGVMPNTELVSGLVKTDDQGYIVVGADCMTSISGIFAAGDAANPDSPTISTAVGMGSTAIKVIKARFSEPTNSAP